MHTSLHGTMWHGFRSNNVRYNQLLKHFLSPFRGHVRFLEDETPRAQQIQRYFCDITVDLAEVSAI